MNNEQKATVESYIVLLAEFIEARIDAAAFETSYLLKFKNEQVQLPLPIFKELDRMFGDVDAYNSDPLIRSDGDLSAEELVASAKRAFAVLKGRV